MLFYRRLHNFYYMDLQQTLSSKKYFSFILMLLLSVSSLAQDVPQPVINSILNGTVTDAVTNQPLEGANINIEGTTNQTSTGKDGTFTLKTGQKFPYNIIISFVGYKKEIVTVDGSPVSITLKSSQSQLEDVVIVGYGTQKRSDLTGAVSTVPKVVLGQPASSLDQLLKGAAAGVQVTQTSGQPGGGVSIRIRGGSSIQGGNEPLYVIDGFPVYNNPTTSGVLRGPSVNPLADLNPSDIESISILKDASATAIYGSRGANGVVIVKTKKGRQGRSNISYQGSWGQQAVRKIIPVLKAKDFAVLRNDALYDAYPAKGKYQYLSQNSIDKLGAGTDWQRAAFRTAATQSHDLSVSGGSAKIQYFLSGNYFDQEGVIRNTDFRRLSFRSNIEAQPIDRLKIGANISASQSTANVAPVGLISSLLIMPPTATIYEPDGAYTLRNPFENIFANPIATMNEETNKSISNRLFGTAYGEFTIWDNLSVKILFGVDNSYNTEKNYIPATIYEGSGTNGQAGLGSSNSYSWLNENTLSYNKAFGKNQIDALVGYTQQTLSFESFNAGAQQFVTDALSYNSLQSGSTILRPNSNTYSWAVVSYLGRVNYNYDNRYFITVGLRKDGASRFGSKNKWGNFPSAAVSWKLSEEPFFKELKKAIRELKIRTSYGVTGNQEIGQYQSLSTLYSLTYLYGSTATTGFAPNNISNSELGWEKTNQFNLGLDLAFFDNKLNLSVDGYYKKTNDLLLNVEIPWTSGFKSSLQNFGSVSNKGIEFEISGRNLLNGKVQWNPAFNITFNKNKVLSIGTGATSYISGNYIIQVGQSLGNFYGAITNGILQVGEEAAKGKYTGNSVPAPGDRLYKDINGDSAYTVAADKAIIGNAQPKFIFGFTNNVSYKGFELNFLIQGAYGNKILTSNKQSLELFTGQQNASVTALDRWTPEHPSNTIPRAKLDPAPVFSDRFVEDGSFVRLKNISLTYRLPQSFYKIIGLSGLDIFMNAQNLVTITRYTGFDPEVTSGSNVSPSTDLDIYPSSKSWNAGVRVRF